MKFFKLCYKTHVFKCYLFHAQISKTHVRASKTSKKFFRLRRAFVTLSTNHSLNPPPPKYTSWIRPWGHNPLP